MRVSARTSYAWRCEECGRQCEAPVWHIVDGRERADVLESTGDPDAFGPGLCRVPCPGCGARAHIEAPLLVLRPGTAAPALFATSVDALHQGGTATATALVEQAERAGAFRGGPFPGQVLQLPRRLLPFVPVRDVDRDLADPQRACQELVPYGPPTVANYRSFLRYLAQDREAARTGYDADPSEAPRVLAHALARLPEGSPQWAEVATNLAAAHHQRDDGDRLERWEAARDLLGRATALDRRAHPEFWARIQTNYGLLLAERPDGGPEDLTLGIGHIRAGLAERPPGRGRVDRAYSLLNLELLLYRRGAPDDVQQAEQCYRDALLHLLPEDDPALWSQLRCNLADLLLSRDPADPQGAREAVTAVREWGAGYPGLLDTGRATWLLARACDLLDGPNSPESVRLRRAALAGVSPSVSPSLHLAIGRELLNALCAAGDWGGAADVGDRAGAGEAGDRAGAADVASGMLSAVHALYDAQVTAVGRRSVLTEARGLARWAAFLLARAGRPERAVEAIERGLACELSVAAGRGTVDLAALERLDAALARRYRQARERYRSVVADGPAASPGDPSAGLAPASGAQAAAERALRTVIEEIRGVPGLEGFLRMTEPADVVRAARGAPLVYLVNAPWGSCVLVVPRGPDPPGASGVPSGAGPEEPSVRAVHVPEVSSTSIVHLMTVAPGCAGVGLLLVQQAGALRRALCSRRPWTASGASPRSCAPWPGSSKRTRSTRPSSCRRVCWGTYR